MVWDSGSLHAKIPVFLEKFFEGFGGWGGGVFPTDTAQGMQDLIG